MIKEIELKILEKLIKKNNLIIKIEIKKSWCIISDRLNELRLENRRLKNQVEEFELKLISLVGNIELESSGEGDNKDYLHNLLIEFINETQDQVNIVTPKIDQFYTNELQKIAQKGIPILLITTDRRLLSKPYQKIYDELTDTAGISVINNPNVKYLLVFNTDRAIYSGGALDREELSQSVLIVTIIKESAKLRKIAEIFSAMLPSFMR